MAQSLYLGHKYVDKKTSRERLALDVEDLLTHVFVCGATGSGKTVLGKIIIEEAALAGIPSILIDLKGDLSSLAVPLSNLDQSEIEPWIEARNAEERAAKAGQLLKFHKANLVRSELLVDDIRAFRRKADVRIYTPKSRMGIRLASPRAPAFDCAEIYESDQTFVNPPERGRLASSASR
jgi:DNA helicase HerA-like ATPase